MPVDVLTEIEIKRPRSEVAAYASDPDNATTWYENIKSVEWKSAMPLAVGSSLSRRAVRDEHGGGAVPMETTYTWEDAPNGATKMTLRNRPNWSHRSWPPQCAVPTARI
jgi:hypothetical protein